MWLLVHVLYLAIPGYFQEIVSQSLNIILVIHRPLALQPQLFQKPKKMCKQRPRYLIPLPSPFLLCVTQMEYNR